MKDQSEGVHILYTIGRVRTHTESEINTCFPFATDTTWTINSQEKKAQHEGLRERKALISMYTV